MGIIENYGTTEWSGFVQKNKKNIVDTITLIFARISSVILVLLVLMMIVNILGRRLFGRPISGTVELVQYGMLACMALAVSRTGFEGRHLSVTLLLEVLPKKARGIWECICQLIAGTIFGSLVIAYGRALPESLVSGRVSDILHIPFYINYIILVIAMAIVCLSFLYRAGLAIYVGFFKKEVPAEQIPEETKEGDDK